MNTNYQNFSNQFQGGVLPTTAPAPLGVPNIFPQPNGNVYVLNSINEMGGIPTTSGVAAGLCLNENKLVLKTIQNGAAAQIVYNISPETTEKEDMTEVLKSHKTKIESLEKQIQALKEKIGGKLEWQV